MNGFKKFLTSKFFIVALAVALLVSIVPSVLFFMGQGDYVKATVQLIATPFQWCFTKAGEMLMTGVDTTPIADGDHYEIELKTGW